jgi:general secretion pathway protein G
MSPSRPASPLRRRRRGFSLIEIMVVNGTIAVLATLAMPRLNAAFKRAKTVEAVQTIATIQRTMVEFYNRNGEYPSVDGAVNPPVVVGLPKAPMSDTLPGWKEIGFKPEGEYRWHYSFTVFPDARGKSTRVTLDAFADTDNDGQVGHVTRVLENGFMVSEDDSIRD